MRLGARKSRQGNSQRNRIRRNDCVITSLGLSSRHQRQEDRDGANIIYCIRDNDSVEFRYIVLVHGVATISEWIFVSFADITIFA